MQCPTVAAVSYLRSDVQQVLLHDEPRVNSIAIALAITTAIALPKTIDRFEQNETGQVKPATE